MQKIITKFREASPAAKASMALLFANIVLKGLSLVSGPVFTRIMSTDQYGIVSTYQSWQSLLAVIITLNLSSGVFNNGMLEFKDNRDQFEASLLAISTVASGLFLVIFLMFSNNLLKIFELPKEIIFLLFLYYLLVPAYWYWSGRQRYEYKYKLLTTITIVSAVVSLGIGIVSVLHVPESQKAVTRIFSMELVNIVIGLFFYILILIKSRFTIKLEYCVYALKFNVPLIPHYLSMYILSSSDRIMISKMINTSATAIYSVAYTVASVINIVWQSIEASLSPWIYEKLSLNDTKKMKQVISEILLIFAILCIGCTLLAPEIMKVLAPSQYSSGIYVIPSVAAGVFFTGVYSLYMRIELYYKQTGFAAVASTLAALSNIFLNFIFIKLFGFIAAGYTTMVCYMLLSLFHYLNVKHKGYEAVLDNKFIFIISCVVISFTIIVSFLYSYTLLRYLFILGIVLVIFLKKNRIIMTLKGKW